MSSVNLLVDPERGWRIWGEDELYYGPGTTGYTPNPNDLIAVKTGGFRRVVSTDYTTKLHVSALWNPVPSGGVSEEEVIVTAGPGAPSETFRILIDETHYPPRMAFDARFMVRGEQHSHIKVFLGTDITAGGQVVSRRYNQMNQLVGEDIGLEGSFEKVPMIESCIKDIATGTELTAVVYSEENIPTAIVRFVAEQTSYVRRSNSASEYVIGIRLKTPYLDVESDQLRIPINQPMQHIPMEAVVQYKSGREVTYPVDGNRFVLDGIDTYIATVVGQGRSVVLKYYLQPGEVNESSLPGSEEHISLAYKVVATYVDGAHTVKLLTFPSWNEDLQSWDLKHWLVNLDRTFARDVTDQVTLSPTAAPWRGQRYGVTQQIQLLCHLDTVDPMFNKYLHTQRININLISPFDPVQTSWTVEFDLQQEPPYGWNNFVSVEFNAGGYWKMSLASGYTSKETWLSNFFWKQNPLYDERRELRAPDPTHFVVVFKGAELEYTIDQWNSEHIVPNDYENGETLFVKFIRKLPDQDLVLGVAGIPVRIAL